MKLSKCPKKTAFLGLLCRCAVHRAIHTLYKPQIKRLLIVVCYQRASVPFFLCRMGYQVRTDLYRNPNSAFQRGDIFKE